MLDVEDLSLEVQVMFWEAVASKQLQRAIGTSVIDGYQCGLTAHRARDNH